MDLNNLWSDIDLNSKKQNSRCLAMNTILAGKYLVGPVLGQGGFGITYLGYDLNMETRIAIKEYFPVELVSRDTTTMHGDRVLSLSGEKSITYQQGLKKYVAEAQNVSQFSEVPGVVSVKDFFYENETAYIVMEYIDGISLKDYLKEKGGRLSEEETLMIMKPVLEALEKVHNAGIIHRDISPDNIMLTFEEGDPEKSEEAYGKIRSATTGMEDSEVAGNRNGSTKDRKIKSVKLIDFGAARMTAKNDQKSLTIILKHGYAPEEQYRTHGEQGPWTDVYAVCAVMYRMLTGETPVPAMDRMFKDELKTLEQNGAKVDANIEATILKGLAVKKEDRIQNIRELISVLYEGGKVKTAPDSKKKNIRLFSMLAAMVLLSAVVLVVFIGILRPFTRTDGTTGSHQEVNEAQNNQTEEQTSEHPNELLNGHTNEQTKESQNVIESGEEYKPISNEVSVELNKEDVLGEQIAFYDPQRSMSLNFDATHVLICKPDGTVVARGKNDAGQCDVEYWDHVVAVAAGDMSSYGLRTDGTVLYAGADYHGYEQAALWTDIVDIKAMRFGVVGLKKDGTVVSIPKQQSDTSVEASEEMASWKNIKAIETYNYLVYGLTEDGTVLTAGGESEENISGWLDVKYLITDYNDLYGLCEDGTIKTSGGMEAPEGSFLFYKDRLGIRTDGTVYEKNAYGEKDYYNWTDMQSIIKTMSSGVCFGLKSDGTIREYFNSKDEDTSPDEMKNLKSVQCVSYAEGADGLLAVTNSGNMYTYGIQMNVLDVQQYESSISWYNGYAALYEDGTFLYQSDWENEKRIDGVKQVAEMLTHQMWRDNGNDVVLYAYILLMEDGTVKRLGSGFDVNGFEYYKDVFEGYSDVESWNDIVQLEGWGLYDIYGLKADGSVVCAGRFSPNMLDNYDSSVSEPYKQIHVSEDGSLFALTTDGELTALVTDPGDEERGMSSVIGWEGVRSFSLGAYHIAVLNEDGTVRAAGRNHAGQCDVEDWKNVVYLNTGMNCTLGITADGELLMAGSLY